MVSGLVDLSLRENSSWGRCIPLVSLFASVRFERGTISNPLVILTDFMNTLFPWTITQP
jgi:hypothetical protein